jgi:hypothetical protein
MRTHNNTIFVTEFGTSYYDSSFWIQMEWLNEKIRCGFSKELDFLKCLCLRIITLDNFEEFSCFGLKPNDTNVCSGNGVCICHNTCKCNSNSTFNGPPCEKVEFPLKNQLK